MGLSIDQQEATDKFSRFMQDDTLKSMSISGIPGCGKTFLTQELIKQTYDKHKLLQMITGIDGELNIYTTATTNKAAEVLSNTIKSECTTIHSLLKIRPIPDGKGGMKLSKARDYSPTRNSLVIIDEASGIGKILFSMIMESLVDCKVLFVGDKYQTAEVGQTSCHVFDEGVCDVTAELITPHRYGVGSIYNFGQQIRKTIDKLSKMKMGSGPKDLNTFGLAKWKEAEIFKCFEPIQITDEQMCYISGAMFKELIDRHYSAGDNVKIVSWSNNAVQGYNSHVRKLFIDEECLTVGETVVTNKPIMSGKTTLARTEQILRVTAVSEEIEYRGIMGRNITLDFKITEFQPNSQSDAKRVLDKVKTTAIKREGSWIDFYNLKEYLGDLRPTHASTAHKAQGSTYEYVFINLKDIGKCNCPQTVARMLNVAVTRAKTKVYLYGDLPTKYGGGRE